MYNPITTFKQKQSKTVLNKYVYFDVSLIFDWRNIIMDHELVFHP